MARWVRTAAAEPEVSWPVAPLSAAVPQRAPLEEPICVPEYEDFVLARRRLPSEPKRALEAARRAAAADPEVRRRVLGSEAGALALQEAVQLAVLQRIAEGRPVRTQG
ncbi:MAG: hypothetical protein ABMA64_26150 [Myxococcota bacterium]